MNWQPIETHPDDCFARLYLVDGYCLHGGKDVTGQFIVLSEIKPHWRKMRRKPTHWMPLPEPPSEVAK